MILPIRWRLSAVYAAAFSVIVLALSLATYASASRAVDTVVDRELTTRLDGLDDHLKRHLPRYSWPELAESLRTHSAFEPSLLRIVDQDGVPVFEGAMLTSVSVRPSRSELSAKAEPVRATVDLNGRRIRLLRVQRVYQDARYDLVLGADLELAAVVMDRLWTALAVLAPITMCAACWAGYVTSGRALSPVAAIIKSARAIDASKLSERIAVERSGDEIEQLAVTFNGMLDRIEEGFLRVRQFTADASHELRTPTAIMRTAAEVALVNPKADARSYRDALHRILQEAQQSSTLLDDLLFLARADSRVESCRRDLIDLGSQLRSIGAQMRPLADGRQVTLHIATDGKAACMLGDTAQLRRLWLILIDNALAHTPPGGSIHITTGRDGDTAYCEVRDTGSGISPDHLPRIFERFYRVDKARTRNRSGSGLGLAIGARIIALHDATIAVTSTVGAGSTFRVRFPAVIDQRLAQAV